jgi:hypothetical protein
VGVVVGVGEEAEEEVEAQQEQGDCGNFSPHLLLNSIIVGILNSLTT